MVEGHPRTICAELFSNQPSSFDKISKFFLLIAMATRILHVIFDQFESGSPKDHSCELGVIRFSGLRGDAV